MSRYSNIRDPLTLGKVHFKRPKPLAPGEKIKRPGSTIGGGRSSLASNEQGDMGGLSGYDFSMWCMVIHTRAYPE